MTVSPISTGVIGVFDSGVGGLTVVRRIWELMPNERVIFVADQAHVPYGGRPLDEVAGFARGISASLIDAGGAKAIVMACNVSTATALESVCKANTGIEVLGVIAPGAKAALRCTSSWSIGVLATQGTVNTGAYTRTITALDGETGGRGDGETTRGGDVGTGRRGDGKTKRGGVRVTEVACPDFVPLIESEQTESPEAFAAASRYLEPILRAEADVVILGCTHYPFLLPCLRKVAPQIQFIDPAEHTVCELAQTLRTTEANSAPREKPVHTLYTTGDPAAFSQQLSFFLPGLSHSISIKQAEWCGERLVLDVG